MTIRAYRVGHPIVWSTEIEWWVWEDTGEPIPRPGNALDRPCTLCRQTPTPEGHDPCLGTIPGATAACCGHGVQPGYLVWANGVKMLGPVLKVPPQDASMDWQTELVTVSSLGALRGNVQRTWACGTPCQDHGMEYCPCQEDGWQEGDTIVIIDRAYIKRACGCVLDDDRQLMIACEEHNPNNVFDC